MQAKISANPERVQRDARTLRGRDLTAIGHETLQNGTHQLRDPAMPLDGQVSAVTDEQIPRPVTRERALQVEIEDILFGMMERILQQLTEFAGSLL